MNGQFSASDGYVTISIDHQGGDMNEPSCVTIAWGGFRFQQILLGHNGNRIVLQPCRLQTGLDGVGAIHVPNKSSGVLCYEATGIDVGLSGLSYRLGVGENCQVCPTSLGSNPPKVYVTAADNLAPIAPPTLGLMGVWHGPVQLHVTTEKSLYLSVPRVVGKYVMLYFDAGDLGLPLRIENLEIGA